MVIIAEPTLEIEIKLHVLNIVYKQMVIVETTLVIDNNLLLTNQNDKL